MHLTVKRVLPVTATPDGALKVRNGSAEDESFSELLPRAEPLPAMNLQVVSWDAAERGHKQQGLHPNVMSCAPVCTQPC